MESEDRLPAPGVKFVQEPSNELSVDHDGALIDRPEAISPCRKPAGLPVLPTDWNAAQDELLRLGRPVERVWAIHEEVEHHRKDLRALFPNGLDIDQALHHGRCERVMEALAANLEKADLADAHAVKAEALATSATTSK